MAAAALASIAMEVPKFRDAVSSTINGALRSIEEFGRVPGSMRGADPSVIAAQQGWGTAGVQFGRRLAGGFGLGGPFDAAMSARHLPGMAIQSFGGVRASALIEQDEKLARMMQAGEMGSIYANADEARFLAGIQTQLRFAGTRALGGSRLAFDIARNSDQRATMEGMLSARAVPGDPHSAYMLEGQGRVNAVDELKRLREEEVALARRAAEEGQKKWQTDLEQHQKILELRQQERATVEGTVRTQMHGLAGMSPGQLRQVNRDFVDASDGQIAWSGAERLMRAGMGDLPAVQQAIRDRLQANAPNILSRLDAALSQVREAQDRQTEKVADFSTQMADAIKGMEQVVDSIAAEAVKKFSELREYANHAAKEAVDTMAAEQNARSGQGSKAPGMRW